MNKKVVLVAGGTGGHINAALAIGREFEKNSFEITYISGQRYLDYQILKKNKSKVYNLNSMALRFKDPAKIIKSLSINFLLYIRVIFIFMKNRPRFVIGTGGYICGPTLFAAKTLFIETAIVEQNAVMGVTNRLLKSIANKVFINFENTKYLKNSDKVFVTGNPVCSSIQWEKPQRSEKIKLLIFGGSLGAKQINECIFNLIEDSKLSGVELLHQVGKDGVKRDLKMNSKVKYHQVEYIDNMQKAYSEADLIICRSGASTISELEIIKRPAILIPYLYASDNHQFYNATEYNNKNLAFTHIIDSSLNERSISEEILSVIEKIKKDGYKDSSSPQRTDRASEKIYKLITGN